MGLFLVHVSIYNTPNIHVIGISIKKILDQDHNILNVIRNSFDTCEGCFHARGGL